MAAAAGKVHRQWASQCGSAGLDARARQHACRRHCETQAFAACPRRPTPPPHLQVQPEGRVVVHLCITDAHHQSAAALDRHLAQHRRQHRVQLEWQALQQQRHAGLDRRKQLLNVARRALLQHHQAAARLALLDPLDALQAGRHTGHAHCECMVLACECMVRLRWLHAARPSAHAHASRQSRHACKKQPRPPPPPSQQRTCSCGSIMSGQRAALVMMAPFSIDSGSVGRPSLPQRARAASSASSASGETPLVMGMARASRSGRQACSTSWPRSGELKGPAYETNDAASSTSPTCQGAAAGGRQGARTAAGRALRACLAPCMRQGQREACCLWRACMHATAASMHAAQLRAPVPPPPRTHQLGPRHLHLLDGLTPALVLARQPVDKAVSQAGLATRALGLRSDDDELVH